MSDLQRRDQLYAAPFGTWKGPKRASRMTGHAGFADVWCRDRFAFEYKTKGKHPQLSVSSSHDCEY
jgi:hypothetical protein